PNFEGVDMTLTNFPLGDKAFSAQSPVSDTPPVCHWDPESAGPVAPPDRPLARTFTPERLAALQEEAARYAEAEQARASRPVLEPDGPLQRRIAQAKCPPTVTSGVFEELKCRIRCDIHNIHTEAVLGSPS